MQDSFKSLVRLISFNRHFVSASLVYLGMTFLLLCALPEIIVYARSNGEETACSHTVQENQEGHMVTITVPGCADGFACCEATGSCEEIE